MMAGARTKVREADGELSDAGSTQGRAGLGERTAASSPTHAGGQTGSLAASRRRTALPRPPEPPARAEARGRVANVSRPLRAALRCASPLALSPRRAVTASLSAEKRRLPVHRPGASEYESDR